MSDLAPLITATAALLAALGAAGKFIWTKLEARFKSIDNELAHCRRREKIAGLRRTSHMVAIELLLQELERLSPQKSRVLPKVKLLLDEIAALDQLEFDKED